MLSQVLKKWLPSFLGLVLTWVGLSLWQWREFTRESAAIYRNLENQGESILKALVGGIRAHRRLGQFFEQQLQWTLEELAKSETVLTVGILAQGDPAAIIAGKAELLENLKVGPGKYWRAEGLLIVGDFQLEPQAGPFAPGPRRGGGKGPRWQFWSEPISPEAESPELSPFTRGGHFLAALVLDRREADRQHLQAAGLRWMVVIVGGVGLTAVALAAATFLRGQKILSQKQLLESELSHHRQLTQAAAGLAHETRNPLNLIRGWAQYLAERSISAEATQAATTIMEECDRLTNRINHFLAFAKPREPSPVEFTWWELLLELQALFQPDLEAKQLVLKWRIEPEACNVCADRELLRQALFNLLCNAIEFSPTGETIEVFARRQNSGQWRLEVADRGPGVPREHESALFTPYFTTRREGTGLGLAIVRRIATTCGWRCGYAPRPEGGATFWIDGINGRA